MALSGLRVGELIALDRIDVDFKNKVIHVTKNYDYINQIVTSPKSFCSIQGCVYAGGIGKCMQTIKCADAPPTLNV